MQCVSALIILDVIASWFRASCAYLLLPGTGGKPGCECILYAVPLSWFTAPHGETVLHGGEAQMNSTCDILMPTLLHTVCIRVLWS